MIEHPHKVVIIAGLGDDAKPLEWAVQNWKKHNLDTLVYTIGWNNTEISFEPKFTKLIALIDNFINNGHKVSLIGISAGGSAALNAFIERKDYIHRVINICGRLRVEPTTGFRSFSSQTKSSHSFAESVKLCEDKLRLLTQEDLQKIMTIKSLLGDELVPASSTFIPGANNISVPIPEHMISIMASLTLFSKPLIKFLKQD